MNARTRDSVRVAAGLAITIAWMAMSAIPAVAQDATSDTTTHNPAAIKASERAMEVPIHVSYFRPNDARGLNVFESPKHDVVPFTGFKLSWGAAFAQDFQNLNHGNSASAKMVSGVNANQLMTNAESALAADFKSSSAQFLTPRC